MPHLDRRATNLRRLAWPAATIAWSSALLALTLVAGGVLVHVTHHDLWFILDAMNRVADGQVPHEDFASPVGQAFYWPFSLMAQFGETEARTILAVEATVAACLLCLAITGLRPRLDGPFFAALVLLIVVSSLTPRKLGRASEVFSHLALYNQWGFAALVLIASVVLIPPVVPKRPSDLLIGGIVGIAAGYLLLLKVTYFAGAVGLLGLGAAMRTASLKFVVVSIATFVMTVGAAHTIGSDLGAYFADLSRAVAASENAPPLDRTKLLAFLVEGGGYFVAVCALLAFFKALPPVRWISFWRRELLVAAAIIGGGAVISVQNNPAHECPMFPAALLVVGALALRRTGLPQGHVWRRWLIGVILFAPVGWAVSVDSLAVARHTAATHGASACALVALQGTPGSDILFPAQAIRNLVGDEAPESQDCDLDAQTHVPLADWEQRFLSDNARLVSDGINLLDAHWRSGESILAFDFANPFPFLMRAPSPRNALAWWDPDRTFSSEHHPDPQKLFEDVDLVLVPRPGLAADYAAEPMRDIYTVALKLRFSTVADGEFWTLWRKIER